MYMQEYSARSCEQSQGENGQHSTRETPIIQSIHANIHAYTKTRFLVTQTSVTIVHKLQMFPCNLSNVAREQLQFVNDCLASIE